MKNAPALLIEATEVRDILDVWLALDAPFRFCLCAGSTGLHSAPTALELQALTAEDGAERCEITRAASILVLSSAIAPSSSGAPRAESLETDHLSRAPSEAFELAASESLKNSVLAAGSTFEASIFLG